MHAGCRPSSAKRSEFQSYRSIPMDILKVVTANPFIRFVPLHVRSAGVPFDTAVYAEIFKNLT